MNNKNPDNALVVLNESNNDRNFINLGRIVFSDRRNWYSLFKMEERLTQLQKAIEEKEHIISLHHIEKRNTEIKLEFYNRIHGVKHFNNINNSVKKIFKYTSADRFMIFIAINGKIDFNVVSSIFELRKELGEPVIRPVYVNVLIDNHYKDMLKLSQGREVVKLITAEMEDSKLKSFYEMEGVNFSHVRFLTRRPIDDENDFLVFSSLATHGASDFTEMETVLSQLQYDSIIKPSINEILD